MCSLLMCVFVYVCIWYEQRVFWSLGSFWRGMGLLYKMAHVTYFCKLSAASLPHQTWWSLIASSLFISQKKKKKPNSLGFFDFSLSLDEVSAIYIFVCQEGGGKQINKAQANQQFCWIWRDSLTPEAAGLPNWYLREDQEVHTVNANERVTGKCKQKQHANEAASNR